MFRLSSAGSTRKLEQYLESLKSANLYRDLDRFGQRGVDALRAATPVDDGSTSRSWTYEVNVKMGAVSIEWYNNEENDDTNILLLIQYGHGTGTGGYVPGRDIVNPAMKPVFEDIERAVWKKVTSG